MLLFFLPHQLYRSVACRMHEGLQLFEEVVQNPIFQNTPIFVFLNKKDLFEQMMKEGVPLTRCFPDYCVSYLLSSPPLSPCIS